VPFFDFLDFALRCDILDMHKSLQSFVLLFSC